MAAELTPAEAQALVASLPYAIATFERDGTFRFCNADFLARVTTAGCRAHEMAAKFGCTADASDSESTIRLGDALVGFRRTLVPGLGWLCTLADVAAPEPVAASDTDELTGLPGRAAMRETLRIGFETGDRERDIAFAMIDLDRFKRVNDTLGHAMGDKLLAKVAERVSSTLREGDLFARIGGDEFALVQIGAAQPAAIEAVAQRIVDVVSRPYVIDGQMMEIGASVGIALALADASDVNTLMKRADIALYRAKEDGRGAYRFFEAGMDAALRERRVLEADMRRALAYREFELHYQPQKDLPSGRITGFEALIRWRHPERGLVAPDAFIPLAEETGFIVPLGEWIIRQASADCATWPGDLAVAVNVSTRQLMSESLAATIANALEVNALEPSRFEVEVTESVLMADTQRCTDTLRELQKTGVTVSLDDFGTGYSSISYLQSFPFDKLKIDQSFIRSPDPDAQDLVKAIVDMSRHFRMRAVAEGVETEEQAEAMRTFGCQAVQGYWLSKALPGREALELAQAEFASRSEPQAPADGALSEASTVADDTAANLVRLVYTSANAVDAVSEDLDRHVADILAVARDRNAAAGVTGALLFTEGYFAQVLEGPADAVEATFERIQRDDRHRSVNLIEYTQTSERRFGDWSMGYAGSAAFPVDGLRSPAEWSQGGGEGVVAMLLNVLLDEQRHSGAKLAA